MDYQKSFMKILFVGLILIISSGAMACIIGEKKCDLVDGISSILQCVPNTGSSSSTTTSYFELFQNCPSNTICTELNEQVVCEYPNEIISEIILDLMNIKYFNNSYAKCRLCNYPLNNPEVSTYCEICINKYHINIVPLNQHKHDIRLKSRVG